MVEHLVAPGIRRRFNQRGFHFDNVGRDLEIINSKTGETLTEIDIVLENSDFIIAAEVKAEPELRDINKHIKRLEIFREYRSRDETRKKKTIYGAIAGAVFPQEVQQAALDAGFYVIVQSGDTVRIKVPDGFQPKPY
jgi:predicted AAA+ superfamily ATPase